MSTVEKIRGKAEEQIRETVGKVDEKVKEGVVRGHNWMRSTSAFTALVFFACSFIHYSGSFILPPWAQPVRIFGMTDGKHPHLQRSAGLLLFLMGTLNSLMIFDQLKNNVPVLLIVSSFNLMTLVFYAVETYAFWALRVEFMTMLFLIVGLNCFWAAKEYFFRDKVKVKKDLKEMEGKAE
jgi:hypothetical protein